MPRPRDPRRDQAKKKWLDSDGQIKLVDLAKEFEVTSSTIRKWKATDKWQDELKGSAPIPNKSAPKTRGAPKGNRNAVGNAGGGAPERNKNAVTTGEYESIYEDVLSDEERSLFYGMDTSPVAQIEENIRLFTIRERRMMIRVQDALQDLTGKEKSVLRQLQEVKDPIEVHDEKTGKKKIVNRKTKDLVVTEVEEKEFRKIDDILKIEEGLTRIQAQKVKALKLKHEFLYEFEHKKSITEQRLEMDRAKANLDEGEYEDDGFHEALEGKTTEVWEDD